VTQIYLDFTQAVDHIRAVGRGILDIENKEFENSFYDFRTRVKELDRRVGSVIVQGFDDAYTVGGRFKLLDSFDTLLLRPIIADALEKKHAALITGIADEIGDIQKNFVDRNENPPISNNLPPIAGALTWSRGLLERAQLPIEKLKSLDRKILERDDAREVIKVYTALISYLADFENDKIKAWGSRIEDSSQAKLRNPLLMRSAENAVADDGRPIEEALLNVNFDPLLVRLLREVKYFLLLNLDIPQSAMDVFKMYETFRRYTGNLDLVVNMYNTIQLSLLPVERPLVRPQLERIDKILSKGIGDSRDKSKGLNWKSTGIELFIGEAMTEAKEVTELLTLLKGTLKQVESIVDSWRIAPIFERMSKTTSIDDFILLQKKVRQARIAVIKESGNEVHKLLKESNKRLKVSQGSPDWRAYTDFINDIVVAGLVESVLVSLKTMGNQFNPKFLENLSLASLLEIHCDLVNKEITFIPEVGFVADIEDRKSTGVKNLAISWINGMLGVCGAFKRVDTGEGTYLRELSDHPAVQIQRSQIYRLLKAFEDNANDLRTQFKKFEYLWLTDMQALFSAFIREAVVIEEVEFAEIDETVAAGAVASSGGGATTKQEADGSSSGGSRGTWKKTVMNLEMFADKLLHYLTVQKDISDLKAVYDVDFIKINAQPVKQAMATWATKWLYSFSSYLQVHLGSKLNELYTFMKAVNGGLDVPLEGISRDAVMKVMSHIRDVRKRTPEIESLFEPQRDIVMMLKKHSITIDLDPIGGQSALEFLENSKMFWDGTVNKAYRVKESIQPIQNSMLEGIRKDIKAFDSSVQKFAKEFRLSSAFQWQDSRYKDVYATIDKTFSQILSFKEKGKSLNELEDLFELPMSKLTILKDIEEELRLLKRTWDVVVMVDSFYSVWKSTLWADINTELLLDEVRTLQNQIKKQPKITKDWSVTKNLELQVKNLATVLPLVHELHSPAMRDRHWKSVMLTTATSFERGPSFSLQDLLNLNLHKFVDPVMDIVEMATKELKIESKLTMIEDAWHKLALVFDRHRDTEVYIILPPDDILETLEEHSLQLQSMSGMGRFVEFFKAEVTKWLSTLGEVDTNLKLLLIVQRQWGSLESIFLGSADIRSQLPDDTKRFETVDNEFKEMMREVQAKPGVVVCCSADGREATLTNMFKELEKCEKALNEYLEIKKSIFPRFYFVSNAALLDILSNGNNPPKIMPHVGSVFDGIGDLSLCLSSNQLNAIAEAEKIGEKANTGPLEAAKSMISKDREVVNFPAIFEMRGAVEFWLNELVRYMQITLREVLAASNTEAISWDTDKPREEWVFNFPAQITLVSSQITWTEEVERSLEELEAGQEDSVKKYCETCTARINALISLVQGELSKGDRVKIITVITIDVHNRDVVQTLVTKKVENNLDFKWQSQLKFYWNVEERNVNIRICDFSTQYSFEYVGNCGRLVITPLTDRCYVTLTVALRLMLGGAPAGPAGTGKTETTKDLARGLGLPCYVFNCSDQMNYQTMGDIFKGLTQVGAWGTFFKILLLT
jgi:dynein heavy chain, axonemal